MVFFLRAGLRFGLVAGLRFDMVFFLRGGLRDRRDADRFAPLGLVVVGFFFRAGARFFLTGITLRVTYTEYNLIIYLQKIIQNLFERSS